MRRIREGGEQATWLHLADIVGSIVRPVTYSSPPYIDVILDIDAGLKVRHNELYLFEAFDNLVKNAVQAMDASDGGGTLTVQASLKNAGGKTVVVVDVRDTGPGVPAEMQRDLWSHDVVTTTKGVQHGAGLLCARDALRRFGGSIELMPADAPGSGAWFRVELDGQSGS
jgi:C4-dicarboxylate-specific signal transduction histidine kinase